MVLFLLILFCMPMPATAQPDLEYQGDAVVNSTKLRAKVLKVEEAVHSGDLGNFFGGEEIQQLVTIEILSGEFKGQVMEVTHIVMNDPKYDIVVNAGDKVIVYAELEGDGIKLAYISDYARDGVLKYLLLAFIGLLIIFGGIRGVTSVLALGITGVAIIFVLLPAILKGYNPILMTVLVCAAVTAITITFIGGFSVKTLSAIIGTTGGVIVAGLLAMLVGNAAQLTGFSDEEMYMLRFIPQAVELDYRGLLFSGMILGALGAVMDVGMSIASALDEIKKANPAIKFKELLGSGINVGRDIMGTMSNTLILAYTGGALPLLLLFMAHDIPGIKIINSDLIATEVVRALTGSIGLIFSIPITALAAGLLFCRDPRDADKKIN